MARKKNPEPEVVVEDLSTPPVLARLQNLNTRQKIELSLAFLGSTLLLVGLVGGYSLFHYFDQRFLPGTSVDGSSLSGLTQDEALASLQIRQSLPAHTVQLKYENQEISSSSAQLQAYRDLPQALESAKAENHRHSWWQKLQIIMGWQNQDVALESQIRYTPQPLNALLDEFALKVKVESTEPYATLGTSGNVTSLKIINGKFGQELDRDATLAAVDKTVTQEKVTADSTLKVEAQVASTGAQLSETELTSARDRAAKFVGKKLTWSGADQRLHLTDQDLVKLLTFPQGFSSNGQQDILENWRKIVERPPSNAEFEYDPSTLVVSKFVPHRDGLGLDLEKTKEQLAESLANIDSTTAAETTELPLELRITKPEKSLADLNNLGLKEIIGIGESEYDHSIPSRIHNVALTSSRITNHIVKPGEEFSFNKALGDVSAATGFQPAYVIMNGQTVLGDGGGVCQVSTTLFRALLDAGVEITRRRPHSYRVTYYELNSKPGVDATVYTGEVDLRFKNDTYHHILIHSEADSKNLYMKVELYGTSDGRQAEIVDHVTWDARPAPAPVMIPDPSLPPGTRKQIDWAASGIKARFKNVIKDKDGNLIREDTYTSNYVPWSAKYLVGP